MKKIEILLAGCLIAASAEAAMAQTRNLGVLDAHQARADQAKEKHANPPKDMHGGSDTIPDLEPGSLLPVSTILSRLSIFNEFGGICGGAGAGTGNPKTDTKLKSPCACQLETKSRQRGSWVRVEACIDSSDGVVGISYNIPQNDFGGTEKWPSFSQEELIQNGYAIVLNPLMSGHTLHDESYFYLAPIENGRLAAEKAMSFTEESAISTLEMLRSLRQSKESIERQKTLYKLNSQKLAEYFKKIDESLQKKNKKANYAFDGAANSSMIRGNGNH